MALIVNDPPETEICLIWHMLCSGGGVFDLKKKKRKGKGKGKEEGAGGSCSFMTFPSSVVCAASGDDSAAFCKAR